MMIWFSCLCGKTCEICETLLKLQDSDGHTSMFFQNHKKRGVSKYNYVQEIITIKLVIKQ